MVENKSVIEHLEDIEETLKPKEKSLTISEMIGEPFDPYFDSSIIYYYEEDERKFKKHKKGQCIKMGILVGVYLIPTITHLIITLTMKINLAWLFIGDVALLLYPLLHLIYGMKQKRKKIANSKWNLENHVFYKYGNKLGEEDSKGMLAKLFIAYSIFSLLFFFISAFPILFGDYDSDFKSIICLIQYMVLSVILIPIQLIVPYRNYYYRSYIFDNEKSYVLYQYGTWKKFEK